MPTLFVLLAGCADPLPISAIEPITDTESTPQTITGAVIAPESTTPPAAITVGLVHLRFDWGPTVEDTLVSTIAEADGTFTLPLPDEAPTRYRIDDDTGLEAATYFVVAFEDSDGDGVYTEGESLLGSPMDRMVVYLPEQEARPQSWPSGWNIVDSGFAGIYGGVCKLDTDYPLTWREADGYPIFYDTSDPVGVLLRGLPAELTLSGTAAGFEHMGLFSYWTVTEDDGAPPMADVAISDTFSVTLSDSPPDDAWISTNNDWRYALAIPQPYDDLDGSGDYSDGDALEGTTTCLGGDEAVARYTNPITLWKSWRLMDCYSANAGWRMVTYDPDLGWVDFHTDADAADLHLEVGECDG